MVNYPITYLITPGELTVKDLDKGVFDILKVVEVAVESNISLIQVREKNLPASHLISLVKQIVSITKDSNTKVIVNERVDVAIISNADGVHLRSDSMSALKIKHFSPELITVVSCHNHTDLSNAYKSSADFATFSPIFDTPSKGQALGLKRLSEAASLFSKLPIIALGGIDLSNFNEVLENGAAGFAAIRSLNNIDNLRRLKSKIDSYNI